MKEKSEVIGCRSLVIGQPLLNVATSLVGSYVATQIDTK